MNRQFPIAILVGLGAALAGTVLWVVEQLTGSQVFEVLSMPAKLVLLLAFPLCLPALSARFHTRPRSAFLFAIVGVIVTVAVAVAYLPWRDTFCRHFNNSIYRWYWSGLLGQSSGYYGDFDAWLSGWRSGRPHMLEFGILIGFYALVVAGCYFFRLRRRGGFVLAAAIYALLLIVPIATELIVWDYDTFLRGIAFDSISMDLFPLGIWFSGDYTIFLYVFLLIFFAAAAALTFRHATAPTQVA